MPALDLGEENGEGGGCHAVDARRLAQGRRLGRDQLFPEFIRQPGKAFERDTVEEDLPFASGHEALEWISTNFGPLMMLRPMLEAKGEWAALSEQLAALYDRRLPPEYLIVLGRKE